MNTRTIVTVIAAALLSASLVPVSSAQDNNGSAQEGIEIITIIGKRPAPTVATACENGVRTRTDAAAGRQNGDNNFRDEVLESSRPSISSSRRASKRCIEQAATPLETRI